MSATGAHTRDRLVETATRSFAEHGTRRASLLDIARQADQRNRGAVHYHFGSRTGMLGAVLEQFVDDVRSRTSELLAAPRGAGGLAVAVEALVRPVAELADTGWRGRCWVVIVAELCDHDPLERDPEVEDVLERAGARPALDVVRRELAEVPGLTDELQRERLTLLTVFVVHAAADRARLLEHGHGRAVVATDVFVGDVVAMACAMLRADVPAAAGAH